MQSYELRSKSREDTYAIAKKLGELLEQGDVVLLEGDLGAGKTTFTKGIAVGLDIHRNVNSPTFTIIKEYEGRLPLYHMDVYRVEDALEDLGIDEYIYGNGVTVVEWAHLIKEQLPHEYLEIRLHHLGDDQRKLILDPKGNRYEVLCKELLNEDFSD